jgi:hypothetical protein
VNELRIADASDANPNDCLLNAVLGVAFRPACSVRSLYSKRRYCSPNVFVGCVGC